MICRSCHKTIADGSKFCPECGTKVKDQSETKTIQLKCKSCGGTMNADAMSPILSCQFCGSKELIQEDSDVTIQRIKSNTEKEIELEKMKQEEKKANRQAEQENQKKEEQEQKEFKKSKLSKVVFVLTIVCLVTAMNAYTNHRTLPTIIAGSQTVLFAIAWLTGMKFIRKKRPNIHLLFAAAGVVLFFVFYKVNNGISTFMRETYVWPEAGINQMIPKPISDDGMIIDSAESFYISVDRTSENDFQDYIAACIDKGFTLEPKRDSDEYSAFNEEGYKLHIIYWSNNSMSVDLDAPVERTEIRWPTSSIASLMPIPKSNIGKVKWDADYGFGIYVCDTTPEEFITYADEVSACGFTVDYRRGDTYYYGYNPEGYYASLKYEGFNTMFIKIEKPKEKEESTNKDANSNETAAVADTTTDAPETDGSNTFADGIRPEFKEAMDSYEAFFDEYIEFMSGYDANDPAMLIKYGSLLTQYTETMSKMEDLKDDAVNDAETAYYLEVSGRITEKLLKVSEVQ